jgi:hypothetical protein
VEKETIVRLFARKILEEEFIHPFGSREKKWEERKLRESINEFGLFLSSKFIHQFP